MEHFWPCPALEREEIMLNLASVAPIILAGGAVMAPLLAFGHGAEFLEARVRLDKPGWVKVELTADYEDNPLIADEEAARLIMSDAFFVRDGGHETTWTELAPLVFEHRTKPDLTAPVPEDPTWADRPHGLLTAVWEYAPKSLTVQFVRPQSTPHDILMWTTGGPEKKPPTPWQILICGDVSRTVDIQPNPTQHWQWSIAAVGLLIAWSASRRIRRRTMK